MTSSEMQVICNITPTKLYFILFITFYLFVENKVSYMCALFVYYRIAGAETKKQGDDGLERGREGE